MFFVWLQCFPYLVVALVVFCSDHGVWVLDCAVNGLCVMAVVVLCVVRLFFVGSFQCGSLSTYQFISKISVDSHPSQFKARLHWATVRHPISHFGG